MNELEIKQFWNSHPCGESLINGDFKEFEKFFNEYDAFRYRLESHIPKCLDEIDFQNKNVLEIGLGQGADSEQLIRRGARWNGLDLTEESIHRVKTRLSLRHLPFGELKKGSAVNIPWPDRSFDIVFSHGVLHHVPQIDKAQREIARVLKPNGRLIIMMYAKYSLNYLLSIFLLRRLGLFALYFLPVRPSGIQAAHLDQAKRAGLFNYLKMNQFIHRNTDGPLNPYSKVYSRRDVERDFPLFNVTKTHKEFMHAPPLPVHGLPGARWLGWHLWVHLELKNQPTA